MEAHDARATQCQEYGREYDLSLSREQSNLNNALHKLLNNLDHEFRPLHILQPALPPIHLPTRHLHQKFPKFSENVDHAPYLTPARNSMEWKMHESHKP